jgi:AcrR family transcriptional regulator
VTLNATMPVARAKSESTAPPPATGARAKPAVAKKSRPRKTAAMPSMREEVTAYRKDLIVRAAGDAFFEHGYHDCTVDMIAERLSGTKAIVYYYFADKHAILQEIYNRALAQAQALIVDATKSSDDARVQLANFARAYAGWVIDNQREVGIFWREERALTTEARAAVAREQKKMDALVAQIIQTGVAQRHFRAEDVQTTARIIFGMISFIFTWWRNDRRMSREEACDFYAQAALRAVDAASR